MSEVVIYTGTDANVILTLYGEKGKSDEFKLRNKTDNFERGKLDKFKVESEDIGILTKIRIGHDNSGFGAAWFLDKVKFYARKIAQVVTDLKRRFQWIIFI